ncbi:MAG: glycosyl hydrolase 43 family protein [Clostridiales bacterium]|nr:glycosyl hydrolase 43 family protein [Clostridiales bacterium]
MVTEVLWQADKGNGRYKNPILFADYSDPDVIRVEDTYYMTASSFNYTPGLPILVSKDLVNWKLVNYALDNINYPSYSNPAHGKGVWAPAIRYHKGEFYIYYGMPDEGIFMVKTDDPYGKWSEPVLVLKGKGYIDPCPFWDEDGKAYVIHGYAKSRIGFKSILGIFPMSPDGTKAIGEDKFIFDGTKTQVTIEGPKVYKRNGWYYILAPAGGVTNGWQTALRSKNIYGPYEEKIVMHQGSAPINGPHQGGLVDTPFKDEWFVHFQDKGVYGRITHLQPVKWVDGWPVIGSDPNNTGCGEPVLEHSKPMTESIDIEPIYLEASDDFSGDKLSLQWQWLGNHRDDFYSLTERPGYLRLYSLNPSGDEIVTLWNSSNILTQKIVSPTFMTEVKVDISKLENNGQAGLVMIGGQYAYLAIRKEDNKKYLVYVEASVNDKDKASEEVLYHSPIDDEIKEVIFRLKFYVEDDKETVSMAYSLDSESFVDIEYKILPVKATWTGGKVGLFSLALTNEEKHGYADFEYIKFNTLTSN